MVLREQLDHRQRGNLTSIAIWRKRDTDLSIQDIHTFNHLRGGVGPHNSQWHKLENNKLEPYLQVFKSLAGFFDEIANEKKFAYVPDQKLRERLKKAKPYLTHDGRVPTMIDLIEIFEGLQPVNASYLNVLAPEDIKKHGLLCYEFFQEIKRNNFLEPREAWNLFLNQPYSKTISKKDLNLINDLLRGDCDLTEEFLLHFGSTYGKCPVFPPLQSMSDLETPKELIESISKVESYVCQKLKASPVNV
tara:strand:+ start:4348 stop:5088 length:741 start_codon:yes stop_codon:yes gene_type:complete